MDLETFLGVEPRGELKETLKDKVNILTLHNKKGVGPFLDYAAFITPFPVVFVPHEVSLINKFLAIHEIMHTHMQAVILEMHVYHVWLRLLVLYAPLYFLVDGWLPRVLITIWAICQWRTEQVQPFFELDADCRAWIAYRESFGDAEAKQAVLKVSNSFRVKADFGDNPNENLERAKLASKFAEALSAEDTEKALKEFQLLYSVKVSDAYSRLILLITALITCIFAETEFPELFCKVWAFTIIVFTAWGLNANREAKAAVQNLVMQCVFCT